MDASKASSLIISLALGQALSTDYARERTLRVETEVKVELATTSVEIERDGERVEDARGMGGQSSLDTRRIVELDTVLEHAGGKPKRVRRAFATVEGESVVHMGEESLERVRECPLSGVTLEIEVDESGDTSAEVVDGDAPDDHSLLEGHQATLVLDVLLPPEGTEDGGSWDLDSDAIARVLGIDLQTKLFPPPTEDESSGDDGGRGRWRSGRSRAMGSMLEQCEWEGKATLTADEETVDGLACRVVEIEIKGTGEIAEPEGGGPPGGGRAPGALLLDPEPRRDSSVEIELEGRLCFSVAERRPVSAEIEGTIGVDRETERTRRDSTMVIRTRHEGTYTRKIVIAEERKEDEK